MTDVATTSVSPYRVELEVFEGPLDLLLYLIKKNDIDIFDIPITFVLDQYMEYVKLMKDLNIDLAGDFLLLASELTLLKSRMLLPPSGEEEEEEVEDPRAELIRRLLEYQRYKEAATALVERPMLGRDVFVQNVLHEDFEEEGPVEVDLFQLISSFNEVLKTTQSKNVHEVQADHISVTERIYELMDHLRDKKTVVFRDLFQKDAPREVLIVSFLAVLEMIRLKMLRVTQQVRCGDIYIAPVFENAEVEDIEGNVTIH